MVPAFCVQNGGLCSEVVSISLGKTVPTRSPGLSTFQEVPSLWDLLATSVKEHWLLGGGSGTPGICWGLEPSGSSPSPSCLRCWLGSPDPTLGLIVTLPGPVRTATYVGACSAEVTSVLPKQPR